MAGSLVCDSPERSTSLFEIRGDFLIEEQVVAEVRLKMSEALDGRYRGLADGDGNA